MSRWPRRRVLLAAASVAAAAGAGYAAYLLWFDDGAHVVELPQGKSLEVAQLEELAAVPPFTLTGPQGAYTRSDLQGHWSFVFFGYTNCPNACPATLGILNHVQEALQAQGLASPRIVFVSLDPERDTPAVLQRYAAAFGTDTVGVTGSAAALQGLLTFFGVTYERHPGADAASYTLDHTTNFFLLRPDGRWLATFAPADDGDAVLADTVTLLGLAQG